MAWRIATGADPAHAGLKKREVVEDKLKNIPKEVPGLKDTCDTMMDDTRKSIIECIQNSCNASVSEALSIQSKHAGNFMTTTLFKKGVIGNAYTKTWLI